MMNEVVILTALQDELDAVLAVLPDGPAAWERRATDDGYWYYIAEFEDAAGQPFRVRASTAAKMGPDNAASHTVRMLRRLPQLAGMVGVCAGRRAKGLEPGDVIAADMAFRYDTGKVVDGELQPQMVSTNVHPRLIQWLSDFKSTNLSPASLIGAEHPPTLRYQKEWILFALNERRASNAPWPETNEEIQEVRCACPQWGWAIERLRNEELIEIKRYPRLTKAGEESVHQMRTLQLLNSPRPDRPEPAFEIGSFATGNAVVEDLGIFDRLAQERDRKVLALDMEAAAFLEAALGRSPQLAAVVMKGVSDFADTEKDDGSRVYASRAAARGLVAFARYALPLIGNERIDVIKEMIHTLEGLGDEEKSLLLAIATGNFVLGGDFARDSELGVRLQELKEAGMAAARGGGPWRPGVTAVLTAYAEATLPIVKERLEAATRRSLGLGASPEYRIEMPRPALTYEDRKLWRRVLRWPDEYEAVFEHTFLRDQAGLEFLQLGEGAFLVEISVAMGAYQGTYVYGYLDERTDPPTSRLLNFRTFTALSDSYDDLAESQSAEVVGIPWFDPESRELVVFTKARGLGDCGALSRYRIGEGETELLECRVRMCNEEWPEDGDPPEPEEWSQIDLTRTYRLLKDYFAEELDTEV